MFRVIMGVLAMLGRAEPPQKPSEDPELQNPAVEGQLSEQVKKTLDESAVKPAKPAPGLVVPPTIPAPDGVDLSPAGRRVFAEGAFLTPRVGRLVRVGDDAVFVPAGQTEPKDPPLLLMPCEGLARILAGPTNGDVVIGGQVFVYRGRHYLLPTTWHFGSPVANEPPPTKAPEADPSVRDLIRSLEEGASPRGVVPVLQDGVAPEASAAGVKPLSEGSVLVNRRARIIRLASAGGRFAATFDNDPSSPAPPPLVLLPGRMLERIEAVSSWRGENTAYLVSGRVYEYQGRQYLLPVLAQVVQPGDVASMQ